jgi:hypothetical protein
MHKPSDKELKAVADHCRLFERDYSEGNKGFSKQGGGLGQHLANIPAYLYIVNPHLIMRVKHLLLGDQKSARKCLMDFLSENPKFRIKPTR